MDNNIYSYDYKPSLQFFKTGKEKEEKLFVGFELEAENVADFTEQDELAVKISEIMNKEERFIYYKHDGSLDDGIEVVSMPFSLEYIKENKEKIKEMLWCMKEEGYKSHDPNTCGLHFHINKVFFGNTSEEIEENIDKLILFTEYYREKLINFSRRTEFGYCHFLSESRCLTEKERLNLLRIKREKFNVDKYMVVNIVNSKTVEFRLIRGTLNYNTFMASLEFIFSLVRVIKNNKITDICWDDIVNYEGNEFIKDYCKSRNIFPDSEKMKDYTLEYLKEQNKIKANIKRAERDIVANIYDLLVKNTSEVCNQYNKLYESMPKKYCGNIKLQSLDIKYQEKNSYVLLNQYLIEILRVYKIDRRRFFNEIERCIDGVTGRERLNKILKKIDKNFLVELQADFARLKNLISQIDPNGCEYCDIYRF